MRFNMKIAQEKAGKKIEREVVKYIPPIDHLSPNLA